MVWLWWIHVSQKGVCLHLLLCRLTKVEHEHSVCWGTVHPEGTCSSHAGVLGPLLFISGCCWLLYGTRLLHAVGLSSIADVHIRLNSNCKGWGC